MAPIAVWLILIVLVAFVGFFLIALGIVGKQRLSEPRCARCKYDLRAHRFWESPEHNKCPECGSDLSADDAVHFARGQRRPKLIWTGLAILLVPVLLVLGLYGYRSSSSTNIRFVANTGPMGNRTKPTTQLIKELPANANAPWHWQELEARLKSGQLTSAETALAIDELIAHAEKRRESGQSGPLHWAQQFLTAAQQANQLSDEQSKKLAAAYHGPEPKVVVRDRIAAGRPLFFSIQWGNHFDLPGTKFVKALREVRVDGKPVTAESNYGSRTETDHLSESGGSNIWGKITPKLDPGEHELTFIVDAGVLDESTTFVGADNKPGQKKRWRDIKHAMDATIPVKLTVLPTGQQVVQLVIDSAHDPVASGVVKPPRIIVRRANYNSNQVPIDIIFAGGNKTAVPIIGQWFMIINGKEQPLTSYHVQGQSGNYRTSTYRKPLPADLAEVDLVFHPRIEDAERYPEISQIWGKDIVFRKVPIERFDRETTQPATQR